MPDTSAQPQLEAQELAHKSPETAGAPLESLDQSLAKLAKYGGFDFLEAGIDGLQSLSRQMTLAKWLIFVLRRLRRPLQP